MRAAAALTVIVPLVPVMELVTVSVAVIVWLPAVFSVALNVPVPLVKRGVGRQDAAWRRCCVKWTVPRSRWPCC